MKKDDISKFSKITWHDIDKNGYINKPFINKPAVYIYKIISYSNGKVYYYVGSTVKLASRISSHRSSIVNWNKHKKMGSPIFYRSVLKDGWLNFKFGVLEDVYLSNIVDIVQKKKTLLKKEQYYLDNIRPSLNVRKIATSSLGVKRNRLFNANLSKSRRGKSKKPSIRPNNYIHKVVTNETRALLSLRRQGINVKVFDKESNNFVKEFHTITSTALYFGVDRSIISMIYKTGKSYDDYFYIFEVKDIRVWIYDNNNIFIKISDSVKKTSLWSNIPEYTIRNYIKSGKLYKNKFYFYNVNSVANPYFNHNKG